MAGQVQDDEDSITGINVTPLVDITLVLLIIFMVTATYIVKQTIEVELPRAAHGAETDDAGLVAAVRQARDKGEEVQAIVGADKSATHGSVTHLLDVLKGAGVRKFAIQIEAEQPAAR